MAKRKHTKKRHTSRRRRGNSMSGVQGASTMILAIGAGVVAGKALTKFLGSKLDPKILAAGQVAAGLFLPKLVKNQFGIGVGYGLIANGTGQLLTSFGVLSGIGVDDPVYTVSMNGTSELSVINGLESVNGTSDLSVINGMEEMSGVDPMQDIMYQRTREAMYS